MAIHQQHLYCQFLSKDHGNKMTNKTILFFTNDVDLYSIWSQILHTRGIETALVSTVQDVLQECDRRPFDMLIIEATNDSADAFESCRALRMHIANPILLLLDQRRESSLLAAYAAGVDECIVKPVSIRLLLSKIDAWLRRSWNVPTEVLDTLRVGPFFLDSAQRSVSINGSQTVKLTNLEFRLMHLLMSHHGRKLESDIIVERVWGHNGEGDHTVLKNVVYRLRRKIEDDPSTPNYLQNIPGEGYVFYV